MNAGNLKHPVTLQLDPVSETDDSGNRITSYQKCVNVRASVKDVSGRDFYAARAHQSLDVVTFGIRWRDDITDECRIVYQGVTHEIEHINHLGYRRDFMQIKAKAITGEGT